MMGKQWAGAAGPYRLIVLRTGILKYFRKYKLYAAQKYVLNPTCSVSDHTCCRAPARTRARVLWAQGARESTDVGTEKLCIFYNLSNVWLQL